MTTPLRLPPDPKSPLEAKLRPPSMRLAEDTQMIPPPEWVFVSAAAARLAARSFALSHGYDLGSRNAGARRRNQLHCYRGSAGLYYEHEALPVRTSPDETQDAVNACPFHIEVMEATPHNIGAAGHSRRFKLHIWHSQHNHPIDRNIYIRAAEILTYKEGSIVLLMRREGKVVSDMIAQINQKRRTEEYNWPLMQQGLAIPAWLEILRKRAARRDIRSTRGADGFTQGWVPSSTSNHNQSTTHAAPSAVVPHEAPPAPVPSTKAMCRRILHPYLYQNSLSENEKRFYRLWEENFGRPRLRRQAQAKLQPLDLALDHLEPRNGTLGYWCDTIGLTDDTSGNGTSVVAKGPQATALDEFRSHSVKLPSWCGTISPLPDTGHSGFTAVAQQIGLTNGCAVRQAMCSFLGGARAFFRDADLAKVMSGQECYLAKRRLMPHGMDLDFRHDLGFQQSRPKPVLWLCAFDLWLVAQYTQRPVCVFFAQRGSWSSTYLPMAQNNPRPIGLIQSKTGWHTVTVRPGVELPPVRIGGWGQRAHEMTKTWQHEFWHAQHDYARGQRWVEQQDGLCDCLPRGARAEDDINVYM